LHQQQRGNKWGEGRTLSPTEEAWIQQVMQEHFPDELNLDSALWTRSAVQTLIACECGVKMPIRTVGEYLKRWRYTPQKPLKRAYEQDPVRVKAWLDIEYPAIEQQAQQENAEIAWGDESGLRSDAQVGRGYAPMGHTPAIQPNTHRVSINYLASISNQGKVRFMLYTQKLTAQVFITFLERLIAKRARKLMWIVDRHPVHRSEAVRQWLQEHRDKIEMHLLPPYAPQLNPAEYLNCDVKQGVHSKPPTRNLAQLKERLRSHLFKLQKLPTRIVKYFKHPFIAYAA
jgi:transposase